MLAEAWWTKQGRRALFLPEGVKFNALTYVRVRLFVCSARNVETAVDETDGSWNFEVRSMVLGGKYIRRDPLPLGTSSLIPERHRWQFHRCRGYWEANGKRGATDKVWHKMESRLD
jgi:hypothetical protein